jgi:hypothetical protein
MTENISSWKKRMGGKAYSCSQSVAGLRACTMFFVSTDSSMPRPMTTATMAYVAEDQLSNDKRPSRNEETH